MKTSHAVANAFAAPPIVARWQRLSLMVGVAGLIASVIGLIVSREVFFRSWLMGFIWIWGATMGCLAWLMVYHLTGGRWGTVTRRIFEAGTRTLPLVAVAALPVVLGMRYIFEWSRPEVRQHDEFLAHHAWLNTPGFIIRMVLYFAVWFGLAVVLNRESARFDHPGAAPVDYGRLRGIAGIGVILLAFTITFGSVDWVMSLDAHWYSTIWGLIFIDAQALVAIALAIAVLAGLKPFSPMAEVAGPDQFHDLGNLQLAMTMVWAYFWFSQYLIIWSGNIAEEVPFLLNRMSGGWQYYTGIMVLAQFVVPFCVMLSREFKRNWRTIRWLAIWIVFVRWVDIVWLVAPNWDRLHFHFSWQYIAAPAALMGLWLAYFFYNLSRWPLLPAYEPHVIDLLEAEAHGH